MKLRRLFRHRLYATTTSEKRSHSPKRTWIVFILVCAAFAACIACYILRVTAKDSVAFYSYFSEFALIVTAFLTAVYTALLYEELALSHQQLEEMSRQREHQEQPVVVVLTTTCKLEPPHAWPRYVGKRILFFGSRLVPTFSIRNLGNGPAITLDASTLLCGIFLHDQPQFTTSAGQRLPHLASNDTKDNLRGLFVPDDSLTLMHQLLESQGTLPSSSKKSSGSDRLDPLLHIDFLYRGAAGGCFLGHFVYRLHVYDEDVPALEEWHKRLSNIEVDYR